MSEDLTQCDNPPAWAREMSQRTGARLTSFGHTVILPVRWDEHDAYLPLHDVLHFSFADGDGPEQDNATERHFAESILLGGRGAPASPPLPSLRVVIDRQHFEAVVKEHFAGAAFPQARAHTFLRGTPHGRGLHALAGALLHLVEVKADLFSRYCLEIALIKAIALAPPSMLHLRDKGETWGPDLRRVEAAARFLSANLKEPFRLAAVARAAACSERTLNEAFRRYLNLTPLQFQLQCRLEAAYSDLARGEASVTDTALAYGFENLGRFARAFRERFGHNPSRVPRA